MTPSPEDLAKALRLLKNGGRTYFSIDYLRRKMRVGYQSAWEIMHAMEDAGMVSRIPEDAWRDGGWRLDTTD